TTAARRQVPQELSCADMSTPESKPAERRYLICHEEHAFSAGHTSDRSQVLMGLLYPEVVALFFDIDGRFLRLEAKTIAVPAPKHPAGIAYLLKDAAFQASFQSLITEWKRSIGFSPGTISVHKFFIEDQYLGVKDRPDYQQQIIDDPEALNQIACDEEDR